MAPPAALKLQPCQTVRPVSRSGPLRVPHLGELGGKLEGAFPGVPGLAVADDAELDGVVAAIQFGYCSQKPLLRRTVRLDGDVEGVAPVKGDDQRVSCLLLRRTESGPLAAAVGGCLTGNLGAGGDLYRL